MAAVQKKVIVRLASGERISGYLPSQRFVSMDAGKESIELLILSGSLTRVLLIDIWYIAYVTDFNPGNSLDAENLGRQSFLARPRGDGLWLRITFSDNSTLEGLAPANLSLADSLLSDHGILIVPPDPRSNAHRVYIPRTAMANLEFLAVIGAAARQKASTKPGSPPQPTLF